MDIKYNVVNLKGSSTEEIKDSVSVEEPLEMNLKYKVDGKWKTDQPVSYTHLTLPTILRV